MSARRKKGKGDGGGKDRDRGADQRQPGGAPSGRRPRGGRPRRRSGGRARRRAGGVRAGVAAPGGRRRRGMKAADILAASAAELGRRIAAGEVTSVAATEAV